MSDETGIVNSYNCFRRSIVGAWQRDELAEKSFGELLQRLNDIGLILENKLGKEELTAPGRASAGFPQSR